MTTAITYQRNYCTTTVLQDLFKNNTSKKESSSISTAMKKFQAYGSKTK